MIHFKSAATNWYSVTCNPMQTVFTPALHLILAHFSSALFGC